MLLPLAIFAAIGYAIFTRPRRGVPPANVPRDNEVEARGVTMKPKSNVLDKLVPPSAPARGNVPPHDRSNRSLPRGGGLPAHVKLSGK